MCEIFYFFHFSIHDLYIRRHVGWFLLLCLLSITNESLKYLVMFNCQDWRCKIGNAIARVDYKLNYPLKMSHNAFIKILLNQSWDLVVLTWYNRKETVIFTESNHAAWTKVILFTTCVTTVYICVSYYAKQQLCYSCISVVRLWNKSS